MQLETTVAVILAAVVLYAVGYGTVAVFIIGMASVIGWAQTYADDREIETFVEGTDEREA